MALRDHFDVQQPRVTSGGANGVVQVELVGRARSRKLAKSSQGYLYVSCTNLNAIVEILKITSVPHFDRFFVLALTTDPDTLGMEAIIAKR